MKDINKQFEKILERENKEYKNEFIKNLFLVRNKFIAHLDDDLEITNKSFSFFKFEVQEFTELQIKILKLLKNVSLINKKEIKRG